MNESLNQVRAVMGHLRDAWNAYMQSNLLPKNPDDEADFRRAIHDGQRIICTRFLCEAMPQLFQPLDPEKAEHYCGNLKCAQAPLAWLTHGQSLSICRTGTANATLYTCAVTPGTWVCPECGGEYSYPPPVNRVRDGRPICAMCDRPINPLGRGPSPFFCNCTSKEREAL